MCFKRDKPKILSFVQSGDVLLQAVRDLSFELLYPTLLDRSIGYYHTNSKGWAEVFNYIYFRYKMPKYIAGRMDCDDFAVWMKGLVAAEFGLNAIGVVFGVTPLGGHSWDLFLTDAGWLNLEPQTGHFFELGENGYEPKHILI